MTAYEVLHKFWSKQKERGADSEEPTPQSCMNQTTLLIPGVPERRDYTTVGRGRQEFFSSRPGQQERRQNSLLAYIEQRGRYRGKKILGESLEN